MIRTLITISLFIFLGNLSFAQQDSSTYQVQRVKINGLLNQRSLKFGQYDESLKQRSGIFGLQTKKDLRNSNDILRSVVLNDNQIFKEIKVLMEYKDLQNQQKLANAGSDAARMNGYMQTIKKLQEQQEKLNSHIAAKNHPGNGFITAVIGLVLGCVTTLGALKFKNKEASL